MNRVGIYTFLLVSSCTISIRVLVLPTSSSEIITNCAPASAAFTALLTNEHCLQSQLYRTIQHSKLEDIHVIVDWDLVQVGSLWGRWIHFVVQDWGYNNGYSFDGIKCDVNEREQLKQMTNIFFALAFWKLPHKTHPLINMTLFPLISAALSNLPQPSSGSPTNNSTLE